MDKILVKESGKLNGEIVIDGSKNAALPIIAATILCDTDSHLYNVPPIDDIKNMLKIIKQLGGSYIYNDSAKAVVIRPQEICTTNTDRNTVEKLRASFLYAGALLGKYKKVSISYPGGCIIGNRPVDLHLSGLQKLGAIIKNEHGLLNIDGTNMKATNIFLDFPSVGATENLIMAAVLLKGKTELSNAAEEPEIIDLINFLNKAGADIKFVSPKKIIINGVESLNGIKYKIMPDRIETGTFLIAIVLKEGNVLFKNADMSSLQPLISKLKPMGLQIIKEENGIRVKAENLNRKAINIQTMPFPGFPTDLQPQTVVLMTRCTGTSTCIETIFENRYGYVSQLLKMGASIKIDGRMCVVQNSERLSGAEVEACDLRAGAALILAGMISKGETIIENAHYISRGYNNIVKKLNSIGASLKYI